MSQPTPGPWIKHSRFVFRAGDGNLTICELQGSGGKYVERRELELDDPRFGEIHANGRLIAAAPDMLDALRRAEQFIANGLEMGAIRMPAPDSDDSAVNTLPNSSAPASWTSSPPTWPRRRPASCGRRGCGPGSARGRSGGEDQGAGGDGGARRPRPSLILAQTED